MNDIVYYTLEQRPDLIEAADALASSWEPFMLNDAVSNQHFDKLYDWFPDFQLAICDASDRVIGKANSVPIAWDGIPETLPDEGWDWALANGVETQSAGRTHTAVSAIEINVLPEMRGKGLSGRILDLMKANTRAHGFTQLVAPVRPNLKHLYPLTPMDRYVTWKHKATDAPFDPWLRVHWRVGAPIVRVAPRSMTITGTIAEWEDWTQLRFPESGEYIIRGALNAVHMDLQNDIGQYIEPNVWMLHSLSA